MSLDSSKNNANVRASSLQAVLNDAEARFDAMTINNSSSHVDPTRKREIGKSSSASKIPPSFRRRHSPPAYTIVVPLVPTTTEHSDLNIVSNPITTVSVCPAATVIPSNLLSPSSMPPPSLNSCQF
ncbi:hypothetical protein PVK06_022426 [Gossypium arboreum]|uniref:Uncharacterized protein n=1 Tax=Gossypium arboreum TaxID=29729 RepID=A0ABR0P8E2_GOSAR|nr:hypothetical protein PVK06_022426 [Gossypium arboreum]